MNELIDARKVLQGYRISFSEDVRGILDVDIGDIVHIVKGEDGSIILRKAVA